MSFDNFGSGAGAGAGTGINSTNKYLPLFTSTFVDSGLIEKPFVSLQKPEVISNSSLNASAPEFIPSSFGTPPRSITPEIVHIPKIEYYSGFGISVSSKKLYSLVIKRVSLVVDGIKIHQFPIISNVFEYVKTYNSSTEKHILPTHLLFELQENVSGPILYSLVQDNDFEEKFFDDHKFVVNVKDKKILFDIHYATYSIMLEQIQNDSESYSMKIVDPEKYFNFISLFAHIKTYDNSCSMGIIHSVQKR
jgi:hypothetical protein